MNRFTWKGWFDWKPSCNWKSRLGFNTLGATGFVVLVMIACLAAMGRTWWCACGDPVPWSWDIWTEHNSQHWLDPYFFTHVLHGVIFFWGLRWLFHRQSIVGVVDEPTNPLGQDLSPRLLPMISIALAIEAVWEIFENSPFIINRYRESTMALGYTGDSIVNSISDLVACAIGYYFASKLNWKMSVLIAVVFEIGMLLMIRDSLLLNIIMLIYPIEAIKEWQMP